MIAACSDCALVDIVCDEQIDTTAYPKLAMSQGLTYADLDLADVPADKKAQSPYGDSGLFDIMNTWGPEGCRYPYYGYLPDAPLCNECSSLAEAKEDVLNGLWDGPCNDDNPPTWDDDTSFATTPHTPATPANYPGCGCDCADFLRRDLATCTENSCTNVAQQYALPGSKCEGSDVTWDLSASSDNCADNLYGDGSFDSTSGDACLDDDGNVQAASETCYQTLASNDEAALTDKKSNIAQCERGASNEDNCCELNVGAVVGTAIALLVVLVGSILACCKFCPGCPMNNAGKETEMTKV